MADKDEAHVNSPTARRNRAATMLGMRPPAPSTTSGTSNGKASVIATRPKPRKEETIEELRERYAKLMMEAPTDEMATDAAEEKQQPAENKTGRSANGTPAPEHAEVTFEGETIDDTLSAQYRHGIRLSLKEKEELLRERLDRRAKGKEFAATSAEEEVHSTIRESVPLSWFEEGGGSDAVRNILKDVPISYDEDDDTADVECITTVQAALVEQKKLKARLDKAFRVELRGYQRNVMPCAPKLLDLCDAIDDCEPERKQTTTALEVARRSVTGSLRVMSMQRRRLNLKRLLDTVDEVTCWTAKEETVLESLRRRDYAAATIMLGARLFSDNGSPLLGREETANLNISASMVTDQTDELMMDDGPADLSPPRSPKHGGVSSPSRVDAKDFASAMAESVGTTTIGRAAVERWLNRKNNGGSLIAQCLRRDLEALLTGAALADSPLEEDDAPPPSAAPVEDRDDLTSSPTPTEPEEEEFIDSESEHYTEDDDFSFDDFDDDDEDIDLDAMLDDDDDDDKPKKTKRERSKSHRSSRGASGAANRGDDVEGKEPSEMAAAAATTADNEWIDDDTLGTTVKFDGDAFLRILSGLHALRVRDESLPRFILDTVETLIDKVMLEALKDVIGDAGETWEAAVDTLVPSEFHPCTVTVLAALTKLLRSVLGVRSFLDDLDLTDAETHVVQSSEALTCIGDRAVQKCLAAVMAFTLRANLTRAPIEELFHIYRLVLLFVDVCSGASTDGAVKSTRASLLMQLQRVFESNYRTEAADSLVKVLLDDQFQPFPASADDFGSLHMYCVRAEEGEITAAIGRYLSKPNESGKDANNNAAASTGENSEEEEAMTALVNPFLTPLVEPNYTPAVPEGPALQLFDGLPIFTFSAMMFCKRMIEFASHAKGLPSVAGVVLDAVNYFTCVYVWFIGTHFIAPNVEVPLDDESSLNPAVRSQFRQIRTIAFETLPAAGFPLFPQANCHQWKQRAADKGQHYAMVERATAICSLDTIVGCHRLCLQALSPLLQADDMAKHATLTDALSQVSRFCITTGIRRLGTNLLGPDVVVVPIEKFKWDAAANTFPHSIEPGSPSPPVRQALDELTAIHNRLRDQHRDLPTIGMQKTLSVLVFNVVTGFVEGLSRVRKWNDAGRAQLQADSAHLANMLKSSHPTTPRRLLEYAKQYLGVWVQGGEAVAPFVQEQHTLYTTKQLVALVDREGFMKRREMESTLKGLGHEDKAPMVLIEGTL